MRTINDYARDFGDVKVVYMLLESDIQEVAGDRFDMKLNDAELDTINRHIYSEPNWKDIVSNTIRKYVIKSENKRDM